MHIEQTGLHLSCINQMLCVIISPNLYLLRVLIANTFSLPGRLAVSGESPIRTARSCQVWLLLLSSRPDYGGVTSRFPLTVFTNNSKCGAKQRLLALFRASLKTRVLPYEGMVFVYSTGLRKEG